MESCARGEKEGEGRVSEHPHNCLKCLGTCDKEMLWADVDNATHLEVWTLDIIVEPFARSWRRAAVVTVSIIALINCRVFMEAPKGVQTTKPANP